jgi:predicted acylesterase/phospholipase RssA
MITENDDHAMAEGEIKDELDSRACTPESEPRRTRHLLSLDGGGIRGLASLAVLDKLMRLIDPIRPPKPCQVFDIIGGTSTGG